MTAAARRTITDRVFESDHEIVWWAWIFLTAGSQVITAMAIGTGLHFAAVWGGSPPWMGAALTGAVAWFIWLVSRPGGKVEMPATWTYQLTGPVAPHEFDALGPVVATAVVAGLTIPDVELGWSIDGHDGPPLADDAAVVFQRAVASDPLAVAAALRSVRPVGQSGSPIVADARDLADQILARVEQWETGQ